MCFSFKFWLLEYRTDIAFGEGNTNLNSNQHQEGGSREGRQDMIADDKGGKAQNHMM